jgi:transcriptional regulator with XRE-family HTH domain
MRAMNEPPLPHRAPFGDRLRAARTARGLSQWELAARIGTSPVNVRNWERRGVEPSASRIASLAIALGVSADYLLGLVDVTPLAS